MCSAAVQVFFLTICACFASSSLIITGCINMVAGILGAQLYLAILLFQLRCSFCLLKNNTNRSIFLEVFHCILKNLFITIIL